MNGLDKAERRAEIISILAARGGARNHGRACAGLKRPQADDHE